MEDILLGSPKAEIARLHGANFLTLEARVSKNVPQQGRAVPDLALPNANPGYASLLRALDGLRQFPNQIVCSPWVLLICKLIIGLVSAYDIFLTIKYVDSLPSMELNPLGRWLMFLDSGPECPLEQIACFISAKFIGNFLNLCAIELLCCWNHRTATSVALAVASAQLFLLYFLTTG